MPSLIESKDEPGVIPELDLRFEVSGTDLRAATLKEVLRWAYQKYIPKRETPVPAQVPVTQG